MYSSIKCHHLFCTQEDKKNNLIPFYVCATLGTTSLCSFDDIASISQALSSLSYRLWLHVDSAYAGSALICPEFQHLLSDGIEVSCYILCATAAAAAMANVCIYRQSIR